MNKLSWGDGPKAAPHEGKNNSMPARIKTKGFTLVEVVAALVILGILAVVLGVKFSDSNAPALSEAEIFKSYLRYAQLRAMGDISTWGIETVSSNQYKIVTANPDLATKVTLPGAGSATRTLPTGVTMTQNIKIYFDSRGRPVSNTLKEYPLNNTWPTTYTNDVTVTFSGSENTAVTVTSQTGFVP